MLKILVKKQLTEIFRSYFYNPKTNKARSKGAVAGYIILFAVVMVGLLGGMFTMMSLGLCGPLVSAGMGWLYFALMSLLAVLLGAFGSVFNTYSGLYLAKDNDLLLSMPIPVNTLMASRLLSVYLMGLMYSGVVILPLQQKFRYAYVAAVHMINNTFWFPAYKDLWMELERLAGRCGIRIELLPYDSDLPEQLPEFQARLADFDAAFFSLATFRREFFEGLLRMEKPRALLLSELLTHEGVPLYALDNFETGAMAARILLERGYRHPALLAPKFNTATADFRRRIDGFSAVMEENDCPFKLFSSCLLAGVEELNLLQQCVTQLYRRGYDMRPAD